MARQSFIKVTRKGRKATEWFKEVSSGRIHFEIQNRIVELSERTAQQMQNIIRSSLKRLGSTGRLESGMKTHIISSVGGIAVGIGRISELPPYWEIINSGLTRAGTPYVPPKNLGFFASGLGQSGLVGQPVSGGQGEQWVHTGGSSDFLLTPKKAIQPTKYIDISAAQLARHIKAEVRRLQKEYRAAAKG